LCKVFGLSERMIHKPKHKCEYFHRRQAIRRILVSTALLIVSLSAAAANVQAQKTREVILATRRNHQVVVFDARSLSELGHFIVSRFAHSISASADGRTLYLEQPPPSDPNGCCALFSLDLATGSLCKLIYPSSPAVATPDGRLLFTQRGAIGVEVFDATSLARLPAIKAPGNYALHVSPDSQWLFGTTNWQGPSLDVFNLSRGTLVRRLSLPGEASPQGAWLGNQFYLYAHDGKEGNLWQLTPESTGLASPKRIPIPITSRYGKPVWQEMISAGNRLIVYEPLGWWLKLDRRSEVPEALGGLFSIDPATGAFEHLAPAIDFARLLASGDGSNLYGVDAGSLDSSRPPTLFRIETRTGAILKKHDLPRDVWNISVARVPQELIPDGRVFTTPCQNPNAGVRQ
jgi:hypothetical protein